MAVTKDPERGTWTVQCWHRDWQGARRKKTKRGFKSRASALAWERDFAARSAGAIDMRFGGIFDVYTEDVRPRLKLNTWLSKEHMVSTKIMSHFEDKAVNAITPADIVKWQNELLTMTDGDGRPYSPIYLLSITNQMSAIMNHAAKLYGLRANPMHKVERIGSKRAGEMLYWTKDEYLAFSREVMDKPDTASERLYFALNSRSIVDGLVDQLDDFAEGHEGTGLVIVDTLQKVRAPSRDSAYAADYGDVGALKGFADSRGLAVLAVHHTRKMGDADVFNTVSGTTGITGSADSTFVLAKQSRSSEYATLSLTGRDVEFQELKLRFNDCSWELIEKTSAEELAVREGAVLTLKRIM